ncbi:hypothetical protein FGIG_04476 [Fasciola gigantica]|uniref:Uncharacterized protein n=1 Tax=Fasciola gigantica TaxID=46835 RepID=A0A504YP87_FASGI|nr:hypothetical protein FGIG_04476 [Fasciola gigantica]
MESPTTPELVYLMPSSNASSCVSSKSSVTQRTVTCFEAMDEVDSAAAHPILIGQMPYHQAHTQSQVPTPFYVKLDNDGSRPNEDLILALPPGTTVIQALGNLGQMRPIPVQSNYAVTGNGTSSGNLLAGRRVYVTTGPKYDQSNRLHRTASPLTVDVVKSSASPCSSNPGTTATPGAVTTHELDAATAVATTPGVGAQTPTTEFPMSTEDEQFDTSFDAMMNSIDITTFLPGTFLASDDQLADSVFDSTEKGRGHDLSRPTSPPGLDPIDEEPSGFHQSSAHNYDHHSDFLRRSLSCSSSCSPSSGEHSI